VLDGQYTCARCYDKIRRPKKHISKLVGKHGTEEDVPQVLRTMYKYSAEEAGNKIDDKKK